MYVGVLIDALRGTPAMHSHCVFGITETPVEVVWFLPGRRIGYRGRKDTFAGEKNYMNIRFASGSLRKITIRVFSFPPSRKEAQLGWFGTGSGCERRDYKAALQLRRDTQN